MFNPVVKPSPVFIPASICLEPAVDVPVPPLSRLSSVVYVGGGNDDDLDEGSAGKVADDPRAAMPAELVSTAM